MEGPSDGFGFAGDAKVVEFEVVAFRDVHVWVFWASYFVLCEGARLSRF